MSQSISEMLSEFHEALGDEPGRGNAALRVTLHEEEHRELMDELVGHQVFGNVEFEVNRACLARELADVVYVAFGTAHVFNIDLDEALEEIHRAAMEKLFPKCPECSGYGYHLVVYPDPEDDDEYEQCDACGGSGKGQRVVRFDGKIMKPVGFVAPNMAKAVR